MLPISVAGWRLWKTITDSCFVQRRLRRRQLTSFCLSVGPRKRKAWRARPKQWRHSLIVPQWRSTNLQRNTAMNHKISVIIPSTMNVSEVAPKEIVNKWVRCAKTRFAELFGGFTSQNAVGGWLSQEHGLVEESVTVVSSHTNDKGLNRLGEVKAFAAKMGKALGQEAVAVEVDSSLQFIPPLGVAA